MDGSSSTQRGSAFVEKLRAAVWSLVHDEDAIAERWAAAEGSGAFLDDALCGECRQKHLPEPEECPTLADFRATIAEHGAEIVRQAKIILADARAYAKKRKRPRWSPVYGQLVDAAKAVEAEVRRHQELEAREAARAAKAQRAAAQEAG